MCRYHATSLGTLWICCRCGYHTNSLEFCRQCDHIVCAKSPPDKIPLLVIGCPRSGTKYTATLLQQAGGQVGHEWLFADGLVSCHLTVEHNRWRVPSFDGRFTLPRHVHFARILHQIRAPLPTINSLRHWVREPWAALFLEVAAEVTTARSEQDPRELAMRIYLEWNTLAQSVAAASYRVEDLAPDTPALAMVTNALYGIHVGPEHFAEVPPNTNATEGRRARLTWGELRDVNHTLAASCHALGARYGYG